MTETAMTAPALGEGESWQHFAERLLAEIEHRLLPEIARLSENSSRDTERLTYIQESGASLWEFHPPTGSYVWVVRTLDGESNVRDSVRAAIDDAMKRSERAREC